MVSKVIKQNDYIICKYCSLEIKIDKDAYYTFKEYRGNLPTTGRFDLYLYNDSDHSTTDPQEVIKQFSISQIEEIINYYIRFENEAWEVL